MKPKLAGSVHLGSIARRTAHPNGSAFGGGPQMTEISRDGQRVYFTNSLYSAWDKQFYPAGVPGRQVMCSVGKDGGITLDKDFVVDFGPDFGAHQIRLQGGRLLDRLVLLPVGLSRPCRVHRRHRVALVRCAGDRRLPRPKSRDGLAAGGDQRVE